MAVVFRTPLPARSSLRAAITDAYLRDETECLSSLVPMARFDDAAGARVAGRARELVRAVREGRLSTGGLDAFMHEYDLSSQEGVVLMCLAEALLRIPDGATADRLIQDKLAEADWERHLGRSHSLFVNASTWGLMLTGRMVELDHGSVGDVRSVLGRLVARSGEPVVRMALRRAMRILGHQFVTGRTIEEALKRSHGRERHGERYSFDMLGEAALGEADARRYYDAYMHAIGVVGSGVRESDDIAAAPGISVKLSALHPRYEFAQRERVMAELVPRLRALTCAARDAGVALTVDAEEADRLELSLEVFEAVFDTAGLDDWSGFGLAVQAYQKRALPVLDWLETVARSHGRSIPLRLVKGAYWDTEIKRAQERGLAGYPVFTRKAATDVSYLACARRLLDAGDAFHPQFATHNAHTVAAVMEMAGGRPFEFQRLHGMGEALYEAVRTTEGATCRVYAPVGSHEELLPYLVRRLLENGANTSFVNRLADDAVPVEKIVADPVDDVEAHGLAPHPRIPMPEALFGAERPNARGLNLNDVSALTVLEKELAEALESPWQAAPLVDGEWLDGGARAVVDPADHGRVVGHVVEAGEAAVDRALAAARAAHPGWAVTPAEERAAILERAATLFQHARPALMARCIREGGKTIPDALSEVREAVDYCYYYAARLRHEFGSAARLPGPTGERNELYLRGRGVFACISPWNFPLAIFTGQVTAALAAGNAVVAKPAGQTPLVACLAVQLLHEAGVPREVLHLLPGAGPAVGMRLVNDVRTAGVAFTGSTGTAHTINRALAARAGPIAPFVAETGGQNCMIVDSSALPEQVAMDAVQSAFNSAGQRCSALRVLFLQQEIAPRVLELLQGMMMELRIGDPALLATDIGPLIDDDARATLQAHAQHMASEGQLLCETPLDGETGRGTFFAPRAFEIDGPERLSREVFGPVLHVVRYRAGDLERVVESVNATGYGLTLGIHSRIEATADFIARRARVGNVYVNRNMIGSVVGVQPFGGEGLSGTGPKAGGPYYLHRFALERTMTTNTAAVGGNAALLSLDEEG